MSSIKPAERNSVNRACSTVGEASSQAARSAREGQGRARSSQTIRKLQRRLHRSSNAMIGRADLEPRTARFFMAGACFGIGGSLFSILQLATHNVAWRYV